MRTRVLQKFALVSGSPFLAFKSEAAFLHRSSSSGNNQVCKAVRQRQRPRGRAGRARLERCCRTTTRRGTALQLVSASRGIPASKLWRRPRGPESRAAAAQNLQHVCWQALRISRTSLHDSCNPGSGPALPLTIFHRPERNGSSRQGSDRAARPDCQRPGVVGPIAGEHPRASRLFRGSCVHGPAGAGAGAGRAARPDHPRRADAGHARLRGLPHAAR